MKYLIWLVVALAVFVWFHRARKSMLAGAESANASKPRPKSPEPGSMRSVDSDVEPMVQCAHCGIHFPISEAVTHASGAHYCSEEHRRLASF
ncbi:PP0621 family protein [Herbaspirillum lusitanum]|uniref:PP0621 family protein n=1 Tax=Herbaspirillum lusitanum TaxID=213312 RepID=A0ABW9A905_9BURK